jgi:hypothetical protein
MGNTLGQSMENVGRNAQASTFVTSLIGAAAFTARFGHHLEAEIAASKAESKAEIANEKIESLGREIESNIKEAQSASEKLAIEYQLKYKHSEDYASLRKLGRILPRPRLAATRTLAVRSRPRLARVRGAILDQHARPSLLRLQLFQLLLFQARPLRGSSLPAWSDSIKVPSTTGIGVSTPAFTSS